MASIPENKSPGWKSIDGWLDDHEGANLQKLARGRRVLEIGSYKGRSTVCMAEVADSVVSIDSHHGDDDCGDTNTYDEFVANLDNSGVRSKVDVFNSKMEDVSSQFDGRYFDLVFIDGSHDTESVARDTQFALKHLYPGGLIAWHDWDYETVRSGAMAAGINVEAVTYKPRIGVYRIDSPRVLVAIPHTGMAYVPSIKGASKWAGGRSTSVVGAIDCETSSTTNNFNILLAASLDRRDSGEITHMAMCHSDIEPERGWVDILAEEMHRTESVAISAIVPIKEQSENPRTSTAFGSLLDLWSPTRYVYVDDHRSMPETFTDVESSNPGEVLLINTGLMLIDLRNQFWDTFAFRWYNRIVKSDDGRKAQFRPEDWEMSRELHEAGLTYAATWRPLLNHHGHGSWGNRPLG